jgi:mRNA-degrading endonuclease YafQ of YafQ-DinJ toxin-antitoxin module
MYKLEFTSKFKKDLKRIARDPKKKQKTNEVLIILEKKVSCPKNIKLTN